MKRSRKFFKFEEKSNGDGLWNGEFIQPLGENSINGENEEYLITPNI